MAARLNKRHQESTREKIRVGMIVDRLEKNVEGEIELTPTQVQSAKILLDKSLANAPSELAVSGELTLIVDNRLPPTALDRE